jgi:hypothetical protein
VGEKSIPGASASTATVGLAVPQAAVSSHTFGLQVSVALAPEMLQAVAAKKHVYYRPLEGSTDGQGKNRLDFPLYPGIVAEPATAARVLGLRPYPGVGLAVPGGLPIAALPASLATKPATTSKLKFKACKSSVWYSSKCLLQCCCWYDFKCSVSTIICTVTQQQFKSDSRS